MRPKSYLLAALVTLAAASLILSFGDRVLALSELQANRAYKQLSGFTLLAFVALQWRTSTLRSLRVFLGSSTLLKSHRLLGALAPLLFLVHSQTLGFGYRCLLSVCFLMSFATGLFNPELVTFKVGWFRPMWIVVHVGVSSALPLLIAYHVYLSYAFG